MKTSIEWYQNAIFDILKEKENISDEIFLQNMLNTYLQAKEMEKEQIIESFSLGIISHHDAFKNQNKWDNGEQYYNETFKK
jgi:hypothetical protein